MQNKQLLSTLIYIYIIILTFIILYYLYNNTSSNNVPSNNNSSTNNELTIDNFQQTPSIKDEYNRVVSQNMNRISDYIDRNKEAKENNNETNNINKDRIKQLMINSVGKLSAMIDNYISNI
jgi:hypothetical protein